MTLSCRNLNRKQEIRPFGGLLSQVWAKALSSWVLSVQNLKYWIMFLSKSWKFEITQVLYMSFDRFLLAVESRDLSQADKSITYKSVFFSQSCFWMIKFTVIPKKNLYGTWQFGKIDVLVNFIIQKFARLKSKHFSQFFWWQKIQASVVETQ